MRLFLSAAVLLSLSMFGTGCATSYQKTGISGGYSEEKISDDVWRVTFSGNGYATKETVQTYWLYRASELTLEKGYAYFEILSALTNGISYWKEGLESYPVASFIFIPITSPAKPVVELDIKMHKKPFKASPPKSFDAASLLKTLQPYVKDKKCSSQNVCPHEKKYLSLN